MDKHRLPSLNSFLNCFISLRFIIQFELIYHHQSSYIFNFSPAVKCVLAFHDKYSMPTLITAFSLFLYASTYLCKPLCLSNRVLFRNATITDMIIRIIVMNITFFDASLASIRGWVHTYNSPSICPSRKLIMSVSTTVHLVFNR